MCDQNYGFWFGWLDLLALCLQSLLITFNSALSLIYTLYNSVWLWVWRESYITTDGQSASLPWNEAPIWGLRPDFITVREMRICWHGALSLTRGRVCRLQLLLALAGAVILGSESLGTCDHILLSQIWDPPPPTWRASSSHLYPPGTGWPSYTPKHWVSFSSPPTTRRTTVEVFEPSSTREWLPLPTKSSYFTTIVA
jgi:hypothetical protein